VLDTCIAEGSRLRPDVPEEKREELFFLILKVDTLFVPEELHEFPGRSEPSRSISVGGSTAQPQCLRESIVMVARERDQGGVALHSMTLGAASSGACSGSSLVIDTVQETRRIWLHPRLGQPTCLLHLNVPRRLRPHTHACLPKLGASHSELGRFLSQAAQSSPIVDPSGLDASPAGAGAGCGQCDRPKKYGARGSHRAC
jgi:hypothetical protein